MEATEPPTTKDQTMTTTTTTLSTMTTGQTATFTATVHAVTMTFDVTRVADYRPYGKTSDEKCFQVVKTVTVSGSTRTSSASGFLAGLQNKLAKVRATVV